MKTYQITLNEKQVDLLIEAVDFFTRIGMGQFSEVLNVYDTEYKLSPELRDAFRDVSNKLKQIVSLPENGHHGIRGNISGKFRDVYDMWQVLRHRRTWDKSPQGGMSPWFDNPMKTGEIGLCSVEEVKVSFP